MKPKKKSRHESAFKYKARDPEAMKRRSEQRGGRFDSPYKQQFDLWKPKGGDNTIRILPPTWDEAEHYGLDVQMHRWIGADNSNYLCLAKMQNKRCPICVAAKEARDGGEAEEAKALEAAKVCLVWMLDRDKDDNNPLLWPMSWSIDRDIADVCRNKKTGKVLFVDHHDQGYDITFTRRGEGLKTRYSAYQVDREPSPISDDPDVQQQLLDFVTENPLPSILVYKDAKYLEGVLAGQTEAKDEDLEEEEGDEDKAEVPKSRKKPAAKKVARRAAEEDEDEEDEEDEDEADDEGDDDGDDDEPKRGSAKRRPAKKAKDEEEEEEEDEDEEEEEDEADDEGEADDDGAEEEEDDEDPEEEEEDEEEEKPRRGAAKPKPKPKPSQATRRRR